ncbi:PP2C family protein-serine/threonine phosphatase [Tabrizicola sp.]|uniref:PP2C family protein-serine/threonine phosphatase n=1 Tax=Tabrizicola sp. TaxID=2005166 RepID=UPI003F3A1EE5
MWRSSKVRFDVATAIDRGSRDYQEDAVVADFPVGNDCGLGILADGMGGHAAGDAASTVVVTEVFSSLKFRKASFIDREPEVPSYLRAAATAANAAIDRHVAAHPGTRGMGSTLVATALVGPHLYWVSVGDSPLYLHRGRSLSRLNENHSMGEQIDAMVALGQMNAELGRTHPDRSCLTSAISGHKIARINCPQTPYALQAGDIVVVSSDGLLSLDDETLERVLRRNAKRPSLEIAETLIEAVRDLRQTDQDNVSIIVIKVLSDKALASPLVSAGGIVAGGRPQTRIVDSMEVFDAVVIDEDEPVKPIRHAVGR